jgi:hypothetical protein
MIATPAPTALPTPITERFALPPVAPTPSARLVGATTTHIDRLVGYAIDYPQGWYLTGEAGGTTILTSFPLEQPGRGGLGAGQAKIDLLPAEPNRCISLQQLVEEVRNGGGKILWEQQWLLADGTPAVRMQIGSDVFAESAVLLTVVNGRCLRLAGMGDTSLFDAIATSLRPALSAGLNPSNPPPTRTVLLTSPVSTSIESPEPSAPLKPTPALASTESPGNVPEGDAQASQIGAIDALRALFDLPQLPLEFVEITTMINSPYGDLAVALYQDAEGRKYSIVPGKNQVVEIDARAVLASISPAASSLSQDELRLKAEAFVQAAIPDFESRRPGLAYEAGAKGDNYFFDWRAVTSSGATMPPFVQIGLHKSGELFAYYNTLNQN